jgi:hypothetical protein
MAVKTLPLRSFLAIRLQYVGWPTLLLGSEYILLIS